MRSLPSSPVPPPPAAARRGCSPLPAAAADGDAGLHDQGPADHRVQRARRQPRRTPASTGRTTTATTAPYLYAVDSSDRQDRRHDHPDAASARPATSRRSRSGPDGNIYVGDIGDNLGGTWDHVWIYRFPEPKALKDQTVRATQYAVKYADGARNAEALMVHPKTGRVYIADKNEDGGGPVRGTRRRSPPPAPTSSGRSPTSTCGSPTAPSRPTAGSWSARLLRRRAYDWNGGSSSGTGGRACRSRGRASPSPTPPTARSADVRHRGRRTARS